jgi:integrase/recombinase XerD
VDFDIDKIDGKAIADLMQARLRLGATHATVKRDLTATSRVLAFAEAMEWREGNPALSKQPLLKERRDPIYLPTEEAIASVVKAAGERFGALIIAARLTGCRQAELVGLTWPRFDREAGTLDIVGKGNKRRTIKLSPAAHRHMSAQTRMGETIFCHEDGRPFKNTPWDFRRYLKQARRRVERARLVGDGADESKEFRSFRFHDLRHLFAVEALRGGMGIYELSRHLGHTSVATTEIYLAFLTGEEAQRARAA